jgi:imidazolonepropionase-like amidohydrolase
MVGAGLANLRRLASAGVQFACGNDAGAVMGTPAMLREELMLLDYLLNQNGVGTEDSQIFQPADALRAATLNSARALGLEDRLGSLQSGKTADLVILDGDPLSDISLIGSRAAAVFMDGKLVTNNCGLESKPISV